MDAPFFITGLPRSRTAWLANFLTYGPSVCLHDALREGTGVEDLAKRLDTLRANTNATFVGDADPGLPNFARELHRRFPQARWVMVERHPLQAKLAHRRALRGFLKMDAADAAFDQTVRAFNGLKGALMNQHVLEVKFEELDQVETVRGIWDFCVPGFAFSHERFQLLHCLKVEAHAEKVAAQTDREQLRVLGANACPLDGLHVLPVKGSESSQLQAEYFKLLQQMLGTQGQMGQAAYQWFFNVCQLLMTWDHIQDNDPIDKTHAFAVFESVLVDWPDNLFWQAHGKALRPVLANCISAWVNERHCAFKGWDGYSEVPGAMALLVGGRQLHAQFQRAIREQVLKMFLEHSAGARPTGEGQ